MKKYSPINETYKAIVKTLYKYPSNMGFMGSDLHNVVVSAATAGDTKSTVELPVPL
jgi:hypothetical protein